MSNPIRFLIISSIERKLFFEAFRHLLFSIAIAMFVPIRKQSKNWGRQQAESSFEEDIKHKIEITLIGLSVRRAKRILPFQTKCLAEAVAAKQMLDKRNIESTLYLGVAKDDDKSLIAHAWLRSGNTIVTGKKGMEKFVEVGRFS